MAERHPHDPVPCEVLMVRFDIHAPHHEAFEAAVRRNARASLGTEAGCLQFDVCRDPQDPGRFLLYERYANTAAIAHHRRTPHYLAMQTETEAWVRSVSVTHWQR